MLIVPYPSARLLVEMLLNILVNLSSVVGNSFFRIAHCFNNVVDDGAVGQNYFALVYLAFKTTTRAQVNQYLGIKLVDHVLSCASSSYFSPAFMKDQYFFLFFIPNDAIAVSSVSDDIITYVTKGAFDSTSNEFRKSISGKWSVWL